MGGSYGGLITVRLLAVDGSYTSAIAERGLYDWISFGGASDIGPWFDRLYVDAQLPDGGDALWRASSLSHAGSVTTPTLIIHSDSDFRTPIDQGQQLYVLLRRLGVETELMWFPGEGHEMSRSGKPRHRIERFEAILDWHAKHC
jgi:dipeptidyl aminopeptidase/acylaminoacyl peptidase